MIYKQETRKCLTNHVCRQTFRLKHQAQYLNVKSVFRRRGSPYSYDLYKTLSDPRKSVYYLKREQRTIITQIQ